MPVSEVHSSARCRCLDTARIAFGRATPAPPRNLVLVTHNGNVRSLVGVSPGTAEIVVACSVGGELRVVGRIAAP